MAQKPLNKSVDSAVAEYMKTMGLYRSR